MIPLPLKQGLKQQECKNIVFKNVSYDSTSTKTRIETGTIVALVRNGMLGYDSTSTKTRIETFLKILLDRRLESYDSTSTKTRIETIPFTFNQFEPNAL